MSSPNPQAAASPSSSAVPPPKPDTQLATTEPSDAPPGGGRWIDAAWAALRKRFDPIDLTLGGSFVVHAGAYWSSGLALLLFERVFPVLAARIKTQPGKTLTNQQVAKLLKRVVGNQGLLLLGFLAVRTLRPKPVVARAEALVKQPVPSYTRMVKDYLFNLAVFEVVFYVGHRTLHDKRWYKKIHKIHHEFKYPIALASEYAHFIELLLSNIIPGAIGPAITNAHPVSTFVWLTGAITMTNFHHSGLMLPFYPLNYMTRAHDWHHKAFDDQFGVVGFMDKALKTTGGDDYTEFKKEIIHRVGFSH